VKHVLRVFGEKAGTSQPTHINRLDNVRHRDPCII
jgi:hypothetical protein